MEFFTSRKKLKKMGSTEVCQLYRDSEEKLRLCSLPLLSVRLCNSCWGVNSVETTRAGQAATAANATPCEKLWEEAMTS
jgi:hypothetical protein